MAIDLRTSLFIQSKSVYALLIREMLTRYGGRRLGFLWVVLEALAHVSVFAIIKYSIGAPAPDGLNVVLFLITGIVPYFYFRNVINKLDSALSANKGLLVLPQISFLDFFYARFILETATSIFTLFIALIIAHIFIAEVHVHNFLGICYTFALIGLFAFGLGLIFAAIGTVFESINVIAALILRLMYFTSGVLFSIKYIPEHYYDILYWNPMIHLMEMMRSSFFYSYHPVEIFTDSEYVIKISLLFIFIGLTLVLRMKKWVLR